MKQLRFAPLIRVSTEKQERKGESLSTQRKQLEQAIKSLNGSIYRWYAGQESGSPDHERKILDELIADAQQDRFDAIMVVDVSRWSRDNARSKADLAILKKNDIQFYVLGKHMDFNIPFNNLIVGMGTEINEYFAKEQAYKSITNKIERARKGWPSSGQIPFGRTFDKDTKVWGIIKEKQKMLVDSASRYLKGEGLTTIAAFYKTNLPNLHKLLKERSGEDWPLHFKSKDYGIDETIIIKIPRLLPQDVIDRIKKKSESNKTFTHGQAKHQYLLARMIFCEDCGMALFGQANGKGLLYYRHSRTDHCKKEKTYLPAPLIESNVLSDIIRMFGDRPAMEKAAKAAIPNLKEVEELALTVEQTKKALAKIDRGIEKILDMIEADKISGDEVKKRMKKLQESKSRLLSDLEISETKLKGIPAKAAIAKKSALLLRLTQHILKSEKHLERMSWDDKRKLLQAVFDGKDADGNRLGIYIGKTKKGAFIYTIKGILGRSLTDLVREIEPPSPEDYLIEDDYETDEKQNMRGIYTSYHCRSYDQRKRRSRCASRYN